jgi:hypothetical protein
VVPERERSHHHPFAARYRGRLVAVETSAVWVSDGESNERSEVRTGVVKTTPPRNAQLAFCLRPALLDRDRVRTGQHLDVSAVTSSSNRSGIVHPALVAV